jgi:hypothetical protein
VPTHSARSWLALPTLFFEEAADIANRLDWTNVQYPQATRIRQGALLDSSS